MTTPPETSTVRSALAVTAAVERILRPGREGSLVSPSVVVDAVAEAMRRGKELRPDQIGDVTAHLEGLYPATPYRERPLHYEGDGSPGDADVLREDVHGDPRPVRDAPQA